MSKFLLTEKFQPLVELTPTEKCEALFKFDEVSKRKEKKKKKNTAEPVAIVPLPQVDEAGTVGEVVPAQPNQKKVLLDEIKLGVKSSWNSVHYQMQFKFCVL